MSFILDETTELLKKLLILEKERKEMNEKEVNTPKVENTYGVSVNPLTGKMERIK